MIFDGCPLPLGCTVLLWGASAAELTKLKRIVRFGVLTAYHQGLECSYLAEELALATAALSAPGKHNGQLCFVILVIFATCFACLSFLQLLMKVVGLPLPKLLSCFALHGHLKLLSYQTLAHTHTHTQLIQHSNRAANMGVSH